MKFLETTKSLRISTWIYLAATLLFCVSNLGINYSFYLAYFRDSNYENVLSIWITFSLISGLFFVVGFVFFAVNIGRYLLSTANAAKLGKLPGLKMGPAWGIWGWFIPGASLIIEFVFIWGLLQVAKPKNANRSTLLLIFLWILWLLEIIFIIYGLLMASINTSSNQDWINGRWATMWFIFAGLLQAVNLILVDKLNNQITLGLVRQMGISIPKKNATVTQEASSLQSNRKLCQQCQHILRPGAKYCRQCGNSTLFDPANCYACNSYIGDGSAFCPNCGTEIQK